MTEMMFHRTAAGTFDLATHHRNEMNSEGPHSQKMIDLQVTKERGSMFFPHLALESPPHLEINHRIVMGQ